MLLRSDLNTEHAIFESAFPTCRHIPCWSFYEKSGGPQCLPASRAWHAHETQHFKKCHSDEDEVFVLSLFWLCTACLSQHIFVDQGSGVADAGGQRQASVSSPGSGALQSPEEQS